MAGARFGRGLRSSRVSARTAEPLHENIESPCCNQHPIPVLLVMTSNAPDTAYAGLLENYRATLSRFVGPAQVLVSGDTLQRRDYGKTDWPWTMFDPEAKRLRHETVFPRECEKAFAMGQDLAR